MKHAFDSPALVSAEVEQVDVLFQQTTMNSKNEVDYTEQPQQPIQNTGSAATSVTDGGFDINSVSTDDTTGRDEENTGWLNGISADFRSLALTIRDTAGGVVNFVQRSAMNVANEISLLEEEDIANQNLHTSTSYDGYTMDHGYENDIDDAVLHLPWELLKRGVYEEDEELKRRILLLSHNDQTFTTNVFDYEDYDTSKQQHNNNTFNPTFELNDERVELIHRILAVDPQLSKMQSKFSGRKYKLCEQSIWKNYFDACTKVRNDYILEIQKHGDDMNNQVDDVKNNAYKKDEVDAKQPLQVVDIPALSPPPTSSSSLLQDDLMSSNQSLIPCDDDISTSQLTIKTESNDDESFVLCLSSNAIEETKKDISVLKNTIPTAPYSSGMKSIDSMVLIDASTLPPSSTATTTPSLFGFLR